MPTEEGGGPGLEGTIPVGFIAEGPRGPECDRNWVLYGGDPLTWKEKTQLKSGTRQTLALDNHSIVLRLEGRFIKDDALAQHRLCHWMTTLCCRRYRLL